MQMQLGLFVQSCRLGLHSAGTWGTARGQGAGALYSLQSHLGPSRMMAELGPEHPTDRVTGRGDEGHTETTSCLGLTARRRALRAWLDPKGPLGSYSPCGQGGAPTTGPLLDTSMDI